MSCHLGVLIIQLIIWGWPILDNHSTSLRLTQGFPPQNGVVYPHKAAKGGFRLNTLRSDDHLVTALTRCFSKGDILKKLNNSAFSMWLFGGYLCATTSECTVGPIESMMVLPYIYLAKFKYFYVGKYIIVPF